MKQKFLTALAVMMFIIFTPRAKAWFGYEEKQRRIETEQQLVQQQRKTAGWQVAAFVLAAGWSFVFVLGTAIGSKVRRDANKSISQ